MTLRGALNLGSASMILASMLMAFFSYAVNSWVDNVEAAIENLRQTETQIIPRVSKMEAESEISWKNTERRLANIENKIDRLIEGSKS